MSMQEVLPGYHISLISPDDKMKIEMMKAGLKERIRIMELLTKHSVDNMDLIVSICAPSIWETVRQ